MSPQYERGVSLLRQISDLVLGQWRISSTACLLAEDNAQTIYKNFIQEGFALNLPKAIHLRMHRNDCDSSHIF